jgi:hypothetical protein
MMDTTLQLFAGGYTGQTADFDSVRRALDAALSQIPANRVILGWGGGAELYAQTGAYLQSRGVEFFLWLPVFSEVSQLKPCTPVVGYSGEPVGGHGDSEQEDFAFNCPNDPRNLMAVEQVFAERFAGLPFDGVFLDRIRYPSFSSGLDSGLSCFCPRCREQYRSLGFDTAALYRNRAELFTDRSWQAFLGEKARIVTEAVEFLCMRLRGMGYAIGLDVFAPFLSRFVGQDLPALSRRADFLKPMLYRATQAPAGLPFEWDALLRASGADAPYTPDLDFVKRDLAALTAQSHCPVYAGVEWNRVPGIVNPDPAYLRESLDAYAEAGAQGFVLSWNLLDVPPENLAAAADWIRGAV